MKISFKVLCACGKNCRNMFDLHKKEKEMMNLLYKMKNIFIKL